MSTALFFSPVYIIRESAAAAAVSELPHVKREIEGGHLLEILHRDAEALLYLLQAVREGVSVQVEPFCGLLLAEECFTVDLEGLQ